jgi:thioredoxin-disulfide reductase
MYDLIIIGAGPAGLTAGIFAAARAMKTLIIGKVLGGQVSLTNIIENYPGVESTDGYTMMKEWERQVKNDGVEIKYEAVEKIEEVKSGKDRKFLIKTNSGGYECKAVIIAQGKTPRRLNVKGEEELTGKGVSYCVSCDGPLFRGKTVAVIGGGNSALEAALVMSQFGKKVYVINIDEDFTGFESLQKGLKVAGNVEVMHGTEVKSFIGDKMLKAIEVENLKAKKARKIEVDGAFVEVGYIVDTTLIKNLLKLDKDDHIVVTNRCQTFYTDTDKENRGKIRPGIFAAGDTTDTPFKQIVIAAGEGAKAALQVYNYIKGVV